MSNHSDCTDIPTIRLDVAYWEQILTTVLIGIIAITGLFGNSMIILAVAFSRKLQTSTNALVASLGCTDLVSSITLVFYMIGSIGKNGWPLPNAYWICQGTAFMVYATIGTSTYTMASIALNRLVIITKPHLSKKVFRSWKLALFIVIPWFVPSFSLMIGTLSGIGELGYDPGDLACAAINTPCNETSLFLFISMMGFPPLVVIIVSYFWIYVYMKRHFQQQKLNNTDTSTKIASHGYADTSLQNVSTDSNPAATEPEFNGPENSKHKPSRQGPSHIEILATRQKTRIFQQQLKITKNLFTVVCGFLLCFLPYFFVTDQYILFYTRVITFANCVINFPIYSLRHPELKVVLGCMMRRSFHEIPQPSKFLKFFLSKKY